MPDLKYGRSYPGVFTSADRQFLYCFKGQTLGGVRSVEKIEKLDLKNEN